MKTKWHFTDALQSVIWNLATVCRCSVTLWLYPQLHLFLLFAFLRILKTFFNCVLYSDSTSLMKGECEPVITIETWGKLIIRQVNWSKSFILRRKTLPSLSSFHQRSLPLLLSGHSILLQFQRSQIWVCVCKWAMRDVLQSSTCQRRQ